MDSGFFARFLRSKNWDLNTLGDLRAALSGATVDDALLFDTGNILKTLIDRQDGPARGIDDYEDGAAVTRLYLRHMNGRAHALDQLLVFKTIARFLMAKTDAWAERSRHGWTPEARQSMLAMTEVLADPEKWREKVEAGLKAEDASEFRTACQAADELGIDARAERFRRIKDGEAPRS